MKKSIALGLLIFLTVWGANAQNSVKAKKLLDQVSAKVQSYNNMVIQFNYILENTSENIKQETRGDVTLEGNKYVLKLMGTTRIFDGKKLYSIIPEDEEVNISTYDPDNESGISPSKMLTFYRKGYSYKWDITQNVKGRKIQYIKLTPTKADADVKEILLGIDSQTKHIYKMIQKQANDTKVTIKVNSFKTDQPLSQNLFTFHKDKYPGYYINKLD